MTYFPEYSIVENAEKNNVSVATVRKYIREHNIDRRETSRFGDKG